MSKNVRVLNRSWITINHVPVKRAMGLLWAWHPDKVDQYGKVVKRSEPKARVLDPRNGFSDYTWEDWSKLRPNPGEPTISNVFRLPRVIVLTRCDRMPNYRVSFNRRAVYERDGWRCNYCGRRPAHSELSLDHVIPKCQGGKTDWFNVCACCTECNSRKAGRTPEQARMPLLTVPGKPTRKQATEDWMTNPETFDDLISATYWSVELVNDVK